MSLNKLFLRSSKSLLKNNQNRKDNCQLKLRSNLNKLFKKNQCLNLRSQWAAVKHKQ